MERFDVVHDPYRRLGSIDKKYLLIPQDEYMTVVTESSKLKDECKVLTAKNSSLEEQISQLKKDIKSIIDK